MQAVESLLLQGKSVKEVAAKLGISQPTAYRVAHKLLEVQHAQLYSGKSRGAAGLLARTRGLIERIETKMDEEGLIPPVWVECLDRLANAHFREAQCVAALAGEQVEITTDGALAQYKQDLRDMGAESLGIGVN